MQPALPTSTLTVPPRRPSVRAAWQRFRPVRGHRIGQLRPVTVYRLVGKGTLEERIIELHHDKRALAEGILAEGGEAASLPSSAELIELMRG